MSLKYFAQTILSFLITAKVISALALWWGFGDKYAIGTALDRALKSSDTTALFLGTSRIKYALDPALFDAAMKARGFHTISYNLGVPAVSFVEMEYQLHEYFARQQCCVKYVFIESDIVEEASLREPNTVRSILFFGAANAFNNFTYLLQEKEKPPPPISSLTYAKYLLTAVFRHYTNAGLFQSFITDTHDNFRAQAEKNGYISVATENERLSDTLDADASLRRYYDDMLDELSAPYSTNHISNKQFSRFLSLMDFIKSKGAEPIVLRSSQFVSAQPSASLVERIRAACFDALPVFDFGRPADNKELFDPRNRLNYDHLAFNAAEQFTLMVADRFAALLDARKDAARTQSSCLYRAPE
jgi:hypothetical protein